MTTLNRIVAAAALAMSIGAANAGSLYFFGDSLSDTGNTSAALSGAVPVITSGTPYAPGQYTDNLGGGVWSAQFASMLGVTNGATFSLAGGNNFSFAGARTYSASGTPAGATAPQVPGLDQQIGMFMGTGKTGTASDLFVIMIGGNDIQQIAGVAGAAAQTAAATVLGGGGSASAAQTAANNAFAASVGQGVNFGLSNISSAISTLVSQRNASHFLIANMPDVGATPYVQSLGASTVGAVNAVVGAWNTYFANMIMSLSATPGLDVDMLDMYGLGHLTPSQITAMGFTNTTDPCFVMQKTTSLQDCSKYFYSDDFHPTSAAHKLIAEAAVKAIPLPGSVALLGLGLIGLVGLRRKAA